MIDLVIKFLFTQILLLTLGTSCAANNVRVNAAGFSSTISVVEKGNCIYVDVVHKNQGRSVVYVLRDMPVLYVANSKGEMIPYAGPFIDEPSLPLTAYKRLRPGSVYRVRVALNRYYDIHSEGTYSLVLNVDYRDPVSLSVTPRGNLMTTVDYKGGCLEHP